MSESLKLFIFAVTSICSLVLRADEKPYISTKSEITLLSANDGETDIFWRKTPEGLVDQEIKTQDSFTVIRLGPDHPPITRTIYGTVPCSIAGTPTMAMSADGRYGLITNHGVRLDAWGSRTFKDGEPLTNDDIEDADLSKQYLAPPLSDMLSMIDLASSDFSVTHRALFDDHPVHVLAHPDGKHFVVGASEYFYVFRIDEGKLVEVSRSRHDNGPPCFWIHPAGHRIIATQGHVGPTTDPIRVHWYAFTPENIRHLSEVKTKPGTDTQLLPSSYIVRVSLDGKKAFICQDSFGLAGTLCDVLIVDLTKDPPVINGVIKQVGDGIESFAFHPNEKMAVVTCLPTKDNSIAVLDIERTPPKILYYLDTGGIAQGVEFTPEGDKLFVGSAMANRIEVFDVVGEFAIRKSQKFLKTGHGHCSLTLGPTYRATTGANLHKLVTSDGVELHYAEKGEGEPIIFIHGTTGDYSVWNNQLEAFARQGYRAIAYSRRYNYPNNNPEKPNHSAAVEADDLEGLLRGLRIEKAHIVGHSYGGYTALLFALKNPQLVRTLTVAEPPLVPWLKALPADQAAEGRARFRKVMTELVAPVKEAFEAGDNELAYGRFLDAVGGKGTLDELPSHLSDMGRRNIRELKAIMTSDTPFPEVGRDQIRRLGLPTLIISGDISTDIGKLTDPELERVIPASSRKRVVLEGATHLMWTEQPDQCRKAVLEFIRAK